MRRLLCALVVMLLLASGCSNSEVSAPVELDSERLFVSSRDPSTISKEAGCGSDDAVAIYLETVAVRRQQVKENLGSADPEQEIELRVAFARSTAWEDIDPGPDSGVEVSGIGIVLPELLNSDAVQARSSVETGAGPIDGLIDKLGELLATRQGYLDTQLDRYQLAVDAGNEGAIKKREARVRTQTLKRDRLEQELNTLIDVGPSAVAISILGRPAALADYLNALPEQVVHDAWIVPTGVSALLVRTRWDSAFSSVEELKAIFVYTAMLPMSLQLATAKSGYGCVLGGDTDHGQIVPNTTNEATVLIVAEDGFGMNAILEGYLQDDGVCLSASFGTGSAEFAIVFSGKGNPRYVSATQIAFDDGTLTIGKPFKAGGGTLSPTDIQDYDPAGFAVPDNCKAADNGLFLLDGLVE